MPLDTEANARPALPWRTPTVVLALVAGLSAFAPVQATVPAQCTTVAVPTASGDVCGRRVDLPDGTKARAFLGIPYAEPPVGNRRWAQPEPSRAWQGVRPALQFGDRCPQTPTAGAVSSDATPRPVESEDCLNLNIWVPADIEADDPLPVMVFIHGGAFIMGSSADPMIDGAHMAASRRVVVVSLNYRLGVLGFLALDDLTGNYGLLDQQLALQWVQQNIGRFGGDPRQVTLFGQSAGAMSVSLHLLSAPASQPLFRAAIMQSALLGVPYRSPGRARREGQLFRDGVGCPDLSCLRARSVDELIQAQYEFIEEAPKVFSGLTGLLPFGPTIDGRVLDRQPLSAAESRGVHKPFIIGTTVSEATFFVAGERLNRMQYAAKLTGAFGRHASAVLARYPIQQGIENWMTWAQVEDDALFACPARKLAALAQASAWIYLFGHTPSFPVLGTQTCQNTGTVCHGAELPFVFNTFDGIGARSTWFEHLISEELLDRWTGFARDLKPESRRDHAVKWHPFDARDARVLFVGQAGVSFTEDPRVTPCGFWGQLPGGHQWESLPARSPRRDSQ